MSDRKHRINESYNHIRTVKLQSGKKIGNETGNLLFDFSSPKDKSVCKEAEDGTFMEIETGNNY